MVRINEFPCLHRTGRGRLYHCREFRRFVIDFKSAYIVLRPWEFQCFRRRISRIMACAWSRAQLEQGELIQLWNALGSKNLTLDHPDIVELAELLEAAAPILEKAYPEELWQNR